VRATLGEGRSDCVRLAKVLGDSFSAGAGVGVPLPLVVCVTLPRSCLLIRTSADSQLRLQRGIVYTVL
jgi:hypothetical protein